MRRFSIVVAAIAVFLSLSTAAFARGAASKLGVGRRTGALVKASTVVPAWRVQRGMLRTGLLIAGGFTNLKATNQIVNYVAPMREAKELRAKYWRQARYGKE